MLYEPFFLKCGLKIYREVWKFEYGILKWKMCRNPALQGRKIHVFGEVSLVKFTLQGLKSTLLGSLQPVDMKKQPAVPDFKVAQFRGKTRDLATLSGGDVLPVREWSSTRHGLQPDPSRDRLCQAGEKGIAIM